MSYRVYFQSHGKYIRAFSYLKRNQSARTLHISIVANLTFGTEISLFLGKPPLNQKILINKPVYFVCRCKDFHTVSHYCFIKSTAVAYSVIFFLFFLLLWRWSETFFETRKKLQTSHVIALARFPDIEGSQMIYWNVSLLSSQTQNYISVI